MSTTNINHNQSSPFEIRKQLLQEASAFVQGVYNSQLEQYNLLLSNIQNTQQLLLQLNEQNVGSNSELNFIKDYNIKLLKSYYEQLSKYMGLVNKNLNQDDIFKLAEQFNNYVSNKK